MLDGHPTTRRRFLQGGATLAAASVAGCASISRAATRPNVVLIVVDTLRADHVYGPGTRTPNMDAIMREGLSFTRMYPEAMPTVPTRNSLLSGKRYFPFRNWHDWPGLLDIPGWEPLDDVKTTLTATLGKAGYWTGYATDNPFLGFASSYKPFRATFDGFLGTGGQLGGRDASDTPKRDLDRWINPRMDGPRTRQRVGRYMANRPYWKDERDSFAASVFTDGVKLLDQAAKHRPFVLGVDTFQPHEPWTPPKKYLSMYADPDSPEGEPAMPYYTRVENYLPPEDRKRVLGRMHALYQAEVTMTDRWLGVFMDRLHELGLAEETMIVLVADHGFLFGERGWTGKISTELHPELTHVPLVIVHPERKRAGEATSYFSSSHDVAPTILSMADVPRARGMTGVDLSPHFDDGDVPERPYTYGGYRDSFYIRTDRWALSGLNEPSAFQLYDLAHDPGEIRDVAARNPAKVRELYGIVRDRAGGNLPYYA